MKNILASIFIVIFAVLAVSLQIIAADTDSVTATVTAQLVSVSVTDGAVAYGTVATSSSEDTTSSGVDDSQTADNDGNVTEDFNIMGQDSGAWELADSAGPEAYTHGFCISNCDSSPSWTQFNETTYTTLATSIADTGNQVFDLRLQTPTSTATFTEQSVDVTVQAVAH